MSCIKFTLDNGAKDATKAFNGAILKYLNSEDKSVSALALNYIKTLKDTGLYSLTDQSELTALASFFETRLSAIPAKKLPNNIKDNIISFYKTDLAKYFNNPEETINDESYEEKTIEIKEDTPIQELNTEKSSLSYKMEIMYEGMAPLKEYAMIEFRSGIINASLVDFSQGKIVKNTMDLNENIAAYKNSLAKSLVDFIVSKNINSQLVLDADIYKNGVSDLQALNSIMQAASDTFKEITKYNLKNAYLSKSSNESSKALVDAYNAYALLFDGNFDTTLKNLLGQNLKIKGAYLGAEVPVDTLKYSFENNSHYRKSWGSNEAIDALSENADVSRLLIENTPMLNYITGLPMSNAYLTLKAFNGAMSKITSEENFDAFERYGFNSRLKEYAINFHSAPNTYLKLILEEILGNLSSRNSGVFSISDLNIYKSVYDRFYSDKSNSLYSIVNADYSTSKAITGYNLLESIAGVVDRTKTISYTQYIMDKETGDMKSTRLKQYNDTNKRIRTINNIEIVTQSMTPLSRANLLNKYRIKSISDVSGDVSLYLKYKESNFPAQIVGGKLSMSDGSNLMQFMSEPDMEKLRDYYERDISVVFTPEEKLYIGALEFIDDFAETGFLKGNIDKLEAFKSTFEVSPKASKDRQLAYLTNNLAELANKIAFANIVYMDMSESNVPLTTTLQKYPYYKDNLNKKDERFFYDRENNAIKAINTKNLNTIENLVKAEQIVTGEVYKSVTKNLEGNGVANNGIFNLAGLTVHNINHYIVSNPNNVLKSNIFVANPNMILGTSNKSEASNRQDSKKSASNFSFSEVGYSSIMFDFYGRLLNKEKGKENMDIVDIQPTVYSDKTSFVLWALNIGSTLKLNGEDIKLSTATYSQINNLIKDSIGGYFKETFSRVLNDYRNVFRGELTDEFLNVAIEASGARRNSKLSPELVKKLISLRDTVIKENNNIVSENAKNLQEGKEILPVKDLVDYLNMEDFREILSTVRGQDYSAMSFRKNVPNIENVHAIKNGNFLKPNELLIYQATKMFANDNTYNSVMLRESKKFIKAMLENNVVFPITYGDGTFNATLNNAMSQFMTEEERLHWTDTRTGQLILAKDANGLPLTRTSTLSTKWIRNGESISMNPLLKRYFLTDYLLSENLRLITTGSAIAHPNKSAYLDPDTDTKVNPLSELGIEMELSSRELAQLKRNVIIPGTLKYFQQNTFSGIPPKYKLAVMQDVGAEVYNFKGKSEKIDAHDGSAWVNPVMSILENLSLQDASVGDDKKPIGHSYKSDYGTAVLLKFATFSMYNERMRNSQLSEISQLALFQKMSGQDWNTYYPQGIDLEIGIFGQPITLQDMSKNERVFYRNGNKHYEILSLNKEAGQDMYSTTIQAVDINGNKIDGTVTNTPAQTVNSVFGIHQILGGVFSESLGKEGELKYSDNSLHITANYVNNIGEFRGQEGEALTQSNTYQPLKHNMIAYLVNKTAIKVGAENVNSANAWFDKDPNTPLMTMEMDTEGLGIQMDADHHADDSEMTEFSQVISSLEANGHTHDIAKLAYRDLGRVALTSIENESRAVKTLLETDNKSDLYEIIGKAMIDEWRKDPGNLKLTQAILKRVDEEFKKKNIDHIDDLYKVPFSDPSIFSKSISSLSSYINKTAIKRKYAGMGAVMVPAYKIIQFFRFNGDNLSYDDLYDLASEQGITPEEYLNNLQEQENANMKSVDLIEPGDYVKIYTADGQPVSVTSESGITSPAEYSIDEYKTYIDVKNSFNSPEYKFVNIVSKPRDLRPARINWKDSTGIQHNIFDMPAVQDSFSSIKGNTPRQEVLKYQSEVQKTFEVLHSGYMPLTERLIGEYNSNKILFVKKYGMKGMDLYFDEYGNAIKELPESILIPISELHSEAAELVLSKIYADKFNITNNDSISKVLKEGPQFFRDRYDKYHTPKVLTYDMVFTRGNGKHTYVLLDTPKDLALKDVVLENIIKESDFIYRTNEEGKKLYPIQKWNKDLQQWEILVQVKQAINSETLEEVLIVNDPETINKIFTSDRYDSILFSDTTNEAILQQFFEVEMAKEHSSKLIETISSLFEGRTSYADFWNSYQLIQNRIKDENANKKFTSFKKSLDYTVARIPAQTMQSFMKMKAVGFTSSEKNVVFVTHWQTWLQGSDY